MKKPLCYIPLLFLSILNSTYSFAAFSDDCMNYSIKVLTLKQNAVSAYKYMKWAEGGNSDEKLKSYERLNNQLPKLEEFINLLKIVPKRCEKKMPYAYNSLEDKVMVWGMFQLDKGFYQKYLITSDTWIEALNKLMNDIEVKKQDIRKNIVTTTDQEIRQEQQRNITLNKRDIELDKLRIRVNEAQKQKELNDQQEKNIHKKEKQISNFAKDKKHIPSPQVSAKNNSFQIVEKNAKISNYLQGNPKLYTALSAVIHLNGYKCDTISGIAPMSISYGFYVHCNQYRYSYEVEDRGGQWKVTLN